MTVKTYDDEFKYDRVGLSYDGDLTFTFTPPTDNLYNLSDFDVQQPFTAERRLAYSFLRHYAPLPRGRNVFKLADGTYVENEPADMSTVTITYYGGHDHEVTPTEATALTAAGYGDYIL